MSVPPRKLYTEEDYYHTPENVRVELIRGKLYNQAASSRQHQRVLGEIYTLINQILV